MAQIPPDTGATTPPATDLPSAQPGAPAAPQAAPAPAEPPKMEPTTEETFTLTSAQLKERLERAQKTERANWLKANGFADEAAFKARMEQIAAAEKEAEERKRAEMGELERFKADLAAANEAKAKAEQERQAAIEEAEAARTEVHLRGLFAERGIANVDYAFHLLQKAVDALDDDGELDEVEFLDKLVADETQKAALGIAAQTPAGSTPANTAPKHTGPNPPHGVQPEFDAVTATPEQLRAYERSLGIR